MIAVARRCRSDRAAFVLAQRWAAGGGGGTGGSPLWSGTFAGRPHPLPRASTEAGGTGAHPPATWKAALQVRRLACQPPLLQWSHRLRGACAARALVVECVA